MTGVPVSSPKLTPAKHTIAFDFTYDGGTIGKGENGILTVDGGMYREGWISSTTPLRPPWVVTGVGPEGIVASG